MKKETLTAKELAERVKVGDKVFLEVEVNSIDEKCHKMPIKLGFGANQNWPYSHETITILTTEPEARVPQVGDVYEWVDGDGFTVKGDKWVYEGDDKGRCIEANGASHKNAKVGDIRSWSFSAPNFKFLYNIHDCEKETAHEVHAGDTYPDGMEWRTISACKPCVGDLVEWKHTSGIELNKITNIRNNVVCTTFVSGDVSSHTDVENEQEHEDLSTDNKAYRIYRRATPKWQPKEGETVWVKFLDTKADFRGKIDDKGFIECFEYNESMFPVPLSELEPYTGQDKPTIDFSKYGQWIHGGEFILQTTGEIHKSSKHLFGARPLGDVVTGWFDNRKQWQPCTPEQIEMIKKLLETLRKP